MDSSSISRAYSATYYRYPPEDIEEFKKEKEETKGFGNGVKEIIGNIVNMPLVQLS